jgi:hypothetical protein
MRGRAETVRSAAVWADITRPYPGGQEGVQTMVDISFRVGHEPGTTPFADTSAFELSRWRGGRYRVYSLKRRWSLEELTVQRYDDVDMSGDTRSTSMNINNYLIAQLLFLQ